MKAFFDTSTLIPLFYPEHAHNGPSLATIGRFTHAKAFVAAHSLIEIYSTLTRMPGNKRANPHQALLFVESVRERVTVIDMTGEDVYLALVECASRAITGGAAYDAMLGANALKVAPDFIYTWNIKHFQRLGPDIAKRLRTPGTLE